MKPPCCCITHRPRSDRQAAETGYEMTVCGARDCLTASRDDQIGKWYGTSGVSCSSTVVVTISSGTHRSYRTDVPSDERALPPVCWYISRPSCRRFLVLPQSSLPPTTRSSVSESTSPARYLFKPNAFNVPSDVAHHVTHHDGTRNALVVVNVVGIVNALAAKEAHVSGASRRTIMEHYGPICNMM